MTVTESTGKSKIQRLIETPKRLKIAVGGRAAGRSIAISDAFLGFCAEGERLCCAKEVMSSISDSSHTLLKDRLALIKRFTDKKVLTVNSTNISSSTDGSIIFKSLSSLLRHTKLAGLDKIWIDNGQNLSPYSIDLLMGVLDEGGPEIWISMNRGQTIDPVSEAFLLPYEGDLRRNKGLYENDNVIIVWTNYDENPHFPSVLESQRKHDKSTMKKSTYTHVWEGEYSDS